MLQTDPLPGVPSEDPVAIPRRAQLLGRFQGRRRVWWLTFALFTGLGACWALASPLFTIPDEPAHIVRAAGAARGQILSGDYPEGWTFEVPHAFSKIGDTPYCHINQPDVTAGCQAPFRGDDRMVDAITTAGPYPPAFYSIVGLPSVPFPSATGIYLMRGVHATLCAALVASAVACVWPSRSPRLLLAGIAFAVTPTTLWLGGAVNPNGIEVAAAICFWVALSLALTEPDHPERNRVLVRTAVAGSVLGLSRPASWLWVGVIVLILAAWAGRRRVLDFVRDRRTWPVMAAVGLTSATTLVWVTYYGTLSGTPGLGANEDPLVDNVLRSLGNAERHLQSMIGVFGWLDTGPAWLTINAWLFAIGALGLVAIAVGRRRDTLVLVSLAVAIVLLPVVLESPRSAQNGFPWQGRYILALAVGLPILAARQIDRAGIVPDRLARRFSLALLVLFAVGQLFGFYWAIKRYTVGVHGPTNWLSTEYWDPTVPVWLPFVGLAVGLGLTVVWFQRLATAVPQVFPEANGELESILPEGSHPTPVGEAAPVPV